MKKIVVLALFAALILSGCSMYTCPTYADNNNEDSFTEKRTSLR